MYFDLSDAVWGSTLHRKGSIFVREMKNGPANKKMPPIFSCKPAVINAHYFTRPMSAINCGRLPQSVKMNKLSM